jgi:hypothetical protein
VFLFWLVLHSMIRWTAAGVLWFAALVLPPHTGGDALARGGGDTSAHHSAEYCGSCARDVRGQIARSREATDEFKQMTGYPHRRPGYVIDHIVPLKRCGPDTPSNMQWQTIEDARAKDKWE